MIIWILPEDIFVFFPENRMKLLLSFFQEADILCSHPGQPAGSLMLPVFPLPKKFLENGSRSEIPAEAQKMKTKSPLALRVPKFLLQMAKRMHSSTWETDGCRIISQTVAISGFQLNGKKVIRLSGGIQTGTCVNFNNIFPITGFKEPGTGTTSSEFFE